MSRGTTIRSVRVPDELWDAALACAAAEGRALSETVRDALADYVSRSEVETRPSVTSPP